MEKVAKIRENVTYIIKRSMKKKIIFSVIEVVNVEI